MNKKYLVVGMVESRSGGCLDMSPMIYYADSEEEIKKYEYEFYVCTLTIIDLEGGKKYAQGWVQAKNPAYLDFD